MASSETDRDPLEVLFDRFVREARAGGTTDVEKYALQYPEHAEEIRDLFPTLMTLEQAARPVRKPLSSSEMKNFAGGLQLGDYRLLREIGAGGMGIVYEAVQESMQRNVAVKVLPREFSADPVRRRRFLQEARTVARMSYRNIVPIIDFGEAAGRCYFTMRLIEGVGLDWLILRLQEQAEPVTSSEVLTHFRNQGVPLSVDDDEEVDDDSLASEFNTIRQQDAAAPAGTEKWQLRRDSWRQFARIGIQAGRALQHAHQQGILHRDIKPGNLLLDEAGTIWITDFGLAKSDQELSLSGPNDVVGTLRYIAPERFEGQLDVRSDIYGLGLTLLELCLQRQMFEQVSRSTLVRQIMDGHITPPRKINPAIPIPLERILLKATAKNPDRRYASAADLIRDLRAYVKGDTLSIPAEAPPPEVRTPARPWPGWKIATGSLAAALLLSQALLWTRPVRYRPGRDDHAVRITILEEMITRQRALDQLYQQTLGRDLTADLESRAVVEPLPEYSPQRSIISELLALHRQDLQTATDLEQTAHAQQRIDRIELLSQLLK